MALATLLATLQVKIWRLCWPTVIFLSIISHIASWIHALSQSLSLFEELFVFLHYNSGARQLWVDLGSE